MSDDNYYKGPCAHCHGTGWYCGAACWRCAGEGTAIRNREETENGEHRTADTPASGGAAEQPGGGAGQAAAYYKSVYDTCIRAGYDSRTAHNLAVVFAYRTQQGTGLTSLQLAPQQAQALQQQNFLAQQAPWANQYGMPYGLPYATTSMPTIIASPFTSGLVQQHGWVEPVPPKPVEDVGISAGEILGHRVWRYDGCLLQSMAQDHFWPMSGPLHDPKVNDHNSHGIHAFKTAEGVVNEYQPSRGFWGETKLVYGTVALWGTVIEHEHGYRGEFARIHSLDSIPQLFRWKELRLLRDLCQRYGLTA